MRQPKIGFLRIAFNVAPQVEELCTEPECLMPDNGGDDIVVTASRAGTSSSSRAKATRPTAGPNITNVQTAGVDEGDVVKQVGDFLAVLQDGRIFAVDIRDRRLRLSDRINVYTDKQDLSWYDEMLVEGNRIIVTAYSYGRQATEISVFKLDQSNGKLAREGRFFINSWDYYSGDNYASRIVGDNLVLYTLYPAALILSDRAAPRLWRWMSEDERRASGRNLPEEARDHGRSLIDAGAVYRPVLRTTDTMVHAVTVCPLGRYRPGMTPECRVTAFAGPPEREFFVSPTAIYLWTGKNPWAWDTAYATAGDRCTHQDTGYAAVAPAAVYRIPINGGAPGVVGLRGQPIDQFSMDETNETFRILTRWQPSGCSAGGPQPTLTYANIPVGQFGTSFRAIDAARHIRVPAPSAGTLENRFADNWLVYGGRLEGYGAVPDRNRQPGSPVFILPVDRPQATQTLVLPHNIIRIERVGETRMAIGGYRDVRGLDLSLLQLGGQASVLDTTRLAGRFESEGRSHAFNSLVEEDGSGLLGLPTVLRRGRAMRYVWNSEGSDVSFLTMSPSGKLGNAGALEQSATRPAPGYRCEVSCIDWYGNSRPIFAGGRIFALMATEIAEGRMGKRRIEEVDRLNLTEKPGQQPRW
ncbi:beta-propeller domain-containing protein [Sphingomonas sp. PB4P5]|uniref:beta-propeller domain-containing protein n=1 Tax=Parasphingomonas puruogangriensis TaxID=3096155 RepID=UPI002FC6CFC7